jgi:large subunit ribosomal protein L21
MYAVIQTGGKQYRVQPGDIVQIEKLEGDVGTSVKFDQVLFASNGSADASKIWLGKPLLSGATVEAEVVGQGRGEKILIIKMKRRKQYRRTQGHRQELTQVLVTSVANGAGETATLSASDKEAKLGKFYTQLKPKGLASTPKTLGSRVRMKNAAREAAKSGAATGTKTSKTAAAPKAATKKKTAKSAE